MYGEHDIIHYTIELDPTKTHGPRYKKDFKPVKEILQTHLIVNLYLAEKTIELKREN
jgi:hypothetical protein